PRRIPPAAQDQPGPRRVPRLRAVVESQAFKNILVDEMDLMLTRAATLIQANWRGYQLRQKLVSQMTAAKAIQEAWRRFHTRRLLRSSRAALRRAVREEGDADIPYHAPQQVRFQPLVDECLGCQPVMVNKETQCPSTNSLATCTQQSPAPLARASGAGRTCSVAFPQPTLPTRLTCPLNLEQKFQTSLLSKMVRNTSVVQQIETEVVKAKPVAARAPRGLEPPPYGRSSQAVPGGLRVQTQAQVDAECLRPPPSPAAPATATKPFLKAYSGISTIRPPAQACPVPTSRTLTQKCAMPTPGTVPTPPQTCSAPAMPRPPAHAHLVVSLTSTSTQTHSPGSLLKVPAPMCLLSSIKMPPQTHPTAAGSKAPTTPCPGPGPVKTSPQVRLAVAPTQSPAVGPSKSSSQTSPAVAGPRPAPQARLAAMLTRTPAHIRNVAAVLKTLCLVHPAVGTLKTPPPATVTSGGPCTPQPVSAPKAKTTVSVKQTAGTVRVSSQSFLLDRKARAGPQPRVNTGAPKGPAKAPLDTEKMKSCAPKHPKPEMVSKSSMTLAMTTASSWTKVAEGKPKPVVQTQQRTEVIRVQSRLLMPMEASMSLPLTKATAQTQTPTRQSKAMFQPRLATAPPATPAQSPPVPCLSKAASPGSAAAEQAKALCQAQLTSCLGRSHPAADLTMVLPNAYPTACPPAAQPHPQLSACLTKTAAHLHPPATQTQVLSQAHLATRLIKVSSQLYSSTEQRRTPSRPHTAASPAKPSEACAPTKLTKASSLAHLVTCLTQVHSHARGPAGLGGDMARCIYRARPPSTHLSSKAQSQPLLAGASSRVSAQTCQDLGPLGSVTRSQSEGRAAHVLPHSQVPGPSVPGPCPAIAEAASMLVPLLASVGCACNVESWGDGEPMSGTRAPPNQMLTCPEDVAASQTASLCAELAAMLGSQEDLRSLLARALSQGEVRAALNQALGATVAKALPHSMLSTALTKALSWGELGVTLTRALSRGELRTELAKAMQGKLTDMLSKALSGEERLALSQTLCPGEPGTVFSQPVSHVSPRPATTLPKAPSTLAGSRMTMPSAPRAVDCRVGQSQSWGAAVSPSGRLPSRKGPVDAGVAGCPSWNPAAAVVTSRPMDRSVALGGSSRELAMGRWAPVGSMADTRQPGTLMVSVQAMEKMVVQAVVIIQACARGYLVRRAIKVWHQWATVIQATWRGHRVRRNLAQLYRATIIIQAAWRGYCTRRERARRQLLPIIWAEPTSHVRLLSHRPRTHLSEGRLASDHRCFLSCQPDVCSLCQALSPGLPAPPSVVMLVGSSPRTCHMCGHTLATRVVQGMGRSVHGQDAKPWAWASTQGSLQLCNQNRAATAIQSAWRGFRTRCLLRRQQVAAKVLQSTWRGHYTRSCLTTDALLGLPGQWNAPSRALPHASRWPGV
ncbi:IQ domain-containing protein N, partial [Perognathus longimembris pacificus]|uniref:IQ domain-containing protein N n=1 Tax=Perognathus longimembris pacificus TaxID=214514 RepID=UPI0020189C46